MSFRKSTRTTDAVAAKSDDTRKQGNEGPLGRYQSMRDFRITSEPSGAGRKPEERLAERLPFVVQKHAATRLHYDFRLAWDGVLKSWAVTKGPSYYPGDKRLAIQVEDHPFEYRDFEGAIPKSQYGGGTVMVWDKGYWVPHGGVSRDLPGGHLKFELHGEKLRGNWALIRMHGRNGAPDKASWLLIKEKDEFARDRSAEAITSEAPDSVASGRSLEEIAAAKDRVWNSNRDNGKAAAKPADSENRRVTTPAKPRERRRRGGDSNLSKIPLERFPGFVAPELAQSTKAAPRGNDWIHELKLDGYRIQIHVQTEEKKGTNTRKVRLLTRKGLDWTHRMPDIAGAAAKLKVTSAILDGEAVALDERGVSSFADLQAAFQEGRQRFITFFAFDLLHLDGRNLRGLPFRKRKKILADLVGHASEGAPIRLSEAIEGDGKVVFEKACELGAEGIVSKLGSAKYSSNRNGAWLKLKCHLEQEFVIGGFTAPSEETLGVGALLLGYYDGRELRYAGRAGTGFTRATRRLLRAKLDRITAAASPFSDAPHGMRRNAHWVKPELVAQIAFSTWTRDNLVRQAAFKGLREDKPSREVTREVQVSAGRGETESPPARKGATRKSGRAKSGRDERDTMPIKDPAITHPDKVLDLASGMTKQNLAEYYIAVAEHLLPNIADRPLSVLRCPDGSGKPCFFQKHVGAGLPAGVKSVAVENRKSGGKEEFLTVDSSQGLVGLAQLGVLEIHPWGSRNEALEKPDRIIFDLDPDVSIQWRTLANAAQEMRKRLRRVELTSFLKSTGGKGLHVVVPICPEYEWPAIKRFAHQMVLGMERAWPDLYVTKMSKSTRKGHIYLDYLRNDRGATAVAPFSPRARPGAPVAMPLQWGELDSAKAPAFHVLDFERWKGRLRNDPWRKLSETDQRLPKLSGEG